MMASSICLADRATVSGDSWSRRSSVITVPHRSRLSGKAASPYARTSARQALRLLICSSNRLANLFALPQALPPLEGEDVRRASFALAGLAVLADWIGSKQEWFPYCEPIQDLQAYWNHAREQAKGAVEASGVLPAESNNHLDYGALIGADATPTPMQDWAKCVELPDGAALFMIEDETGSGKTEAALMLAHKTDGVRPGRRSVRGTAHHGHGQRHVRSACRRVSALVRDRCLPLDCPGSRRGRHARRFPVGSAGGRARRGSLFTDWGPGRGI